MDRHETGRILDAIRDARASGRRAAIATVVRLRGSAYRREGARILIREDGTYECLLSGGCLEPAVVDAAARVIASGEPATVTFDLADESVFGLGIGCGGAVDVRIERVDDDPVTGAWLDVLERGAPAVLVTPLSSASGRLLVHPDGSTTGGFSDPALDADATARALARLNAGSRSAAERLGTAEMFYEISEPPPRLVLFGAGDDARPLALLGRQVGFVVTVVDSRAGLLTPVRFPRATLVPIDFARPAGTLSLDERCFIVIMNHQLERDRASLALALDSPAPYIGVLGTRARYDRLIASLRAHSEVASGTQALDRVRNPIGLALGAETPEEIAVSIVAELLAVRRGFDGGFLDGREASIHRPAASRAFARS
jgi:xanthine/CO dehydrogenase XdhC/CoxF family maturation factor